MSRITADAGKTVRIAYQGENLCQEVAFPLADIMEEFPGGTAVLVIVRPEDTDPVAAVHTAMDGTDLIWTVTAWECEKDGYLYAQITYAVGEIVKKTKKYRFDIRSSIIVGAVEPEDWSDLVGQLVTAAAGVNTAISEAEETLQAAVDAAEDAQEAAEDAQGAAEAAQAGAEAAQAAAEAAVASYDAMTAAATGLPAGSDPTADIDHSGEHPVLQLGVPAGEKGDPGEPGADGFSPAASVSKSGKKTTVTVTDKNGTTSAEILDGEDGEDGDPGADGYSPTAGVSKSGKVTTVTITDKTGTTTAEILDGEDGQDGDPGADGYSPSASVSKSGKVTTVTITDKTGTTSAEILDGEDADPAELIDDTAGSGDTDKTWSADKLADTHSSLLSEITQNKNNLIKVTGFEEIAFVDGKYVYNDTTKVYLTDIRTSSTGYRYAIVSCSAGDVFTVSGTSGSANPIAWAFTASDGTILLQEVMSAEVTEKVVTAPTGTSYLVINAKGTAKSYKGQPLDDLTDQKLDEYTTVPLNNADKRIGSTGAVVNNSTNDAMTDYYPCKPGETVEWCGQSYFYQNAAAMLCVAFFDDTRTYISGSGIAQVDGSSATTNQIGYIRATVPSGAAYVVASSHNVHRGVHYFRVFDVADKINDAQTHTVTVTGTTPTITGVAGSRYVCGEVSTLSITPPQTGIIDVVFTSGSTPTVLTVPNTVRFPAWFDPTSLTANTTYEINIMDGYGSVMSWT